MYLSIDHFKLKHSSCLHLQMFTRSLLPSESSIHLNGQVPNVAVVSPQNANSSPFNFPIVELGPSHELGRLTATTWPIIIYKLKLTSLSQVPSATLRTHATHTCVERATMYWMLHPIIHASSTHLPSTTLSRLHSPAERPDQTGHELAEMGWCGGVSSSRR